MDIDKILGLADIDKIIERLKEGRQTALPSVEEALRALDIKNHDVNDVTIRKDKLIRKDASGGSEGKTVARGRDEVELDTQKVNRVAIALQKLIIRRAASFLFGIPVEYIPDSYSMKEKEDIIMRAFNRIVHDNKLKSLDRKIARNIFAYKECAEYWYAVDRSHNSYGYKSSMKLKVSLFGPHNGDKLYPYFDEYNDLVAFSREFKKTINEVRTDIYFETYTDTAYKRWVNKNNEGWVEDTSKKEIPLGKIPIVYGYQPYFETEDVDNLITRLETLLSNFADTNDYHASPKVVVKGKIEGWSKKGEAGAVIELEGEDADVKYLSWAQAPESVKTEIETLLKLIYTISQTPDISFESVKGLGQVSGVALKLLFMDAHLKAFDKCEIFDEYLSRRANLIKAFIGVSNLELKEACDNMAIEPNITPFSVEDEKENIEKWLSANGGKPLVSHEESVKIANLSQDPTQDYKRIEEQEMKYWDSIKGDPINGLEEEEDFK